MPLVYRSVFADSDGRITAAIPSEFRRWLHMKGLRLPEEGLARRGSALDSETDAIAFAAELTTVLPNGDRIHRLRLVEETPDARWITTVASVEQQSERPSGVGGQRKGIWVDLEHEPTKRSAPARPGSPRIVRELMAVGEGYDGPVPLTSEALILTRDHVTEIVNYIVSPERTVPVIVFAHDAQRAYDQRKLSQLLARDLAGVAAVFVLDDPNTTDRLAGSLPEGYAVYAGAMRTYLPGSLSDPEDVAARHRVLGRTSLVALGARAFPAVKDQILQLSVRRPAPVAFRAPGKTSPQPRIHDERSGAATVRTGWLRERLLRIRAALGVQALDGADEETAFDDALDKLLNRAAAAPSTAPSTDAGEQQRVSAELKRRLEGEEGERRALEELLNEAQEDIDHRATSTKALETAYDDLTIEAIEAATEVDRLERQVRWLERRNRQLGDSEAVVDHDGLPAAPDSVAEVVVLARQHLPMLHLGDFDAEAASLDLHAQAALYAAKSWTALQALNAYAGARHRAEFEGSFFAWCQSPLPGYAAISATAVAMQESETVGNSPNLRQARTFAVPSIVSVEGSKYMPAHIKIVKRGAPAPRLHFHDDVAGSGQVYIGYLGPHLPTARFA